MTKKSSESFLVEEPKAEYKTELNLENKRGDRLTGVLQNGGFSAKINSSNSNEL